MKNGGKTNFVQYNKMYGFPESFLQSSVSHDPNMMIWCSRNI